ncbi:hypothetical protein QP185_00805 [Sphingomonas aerolata]|uniref:hypothetical protein n=1 Tax=Sphingomonas aerolata TaxID=185951 RepID=UPI002FE0B9E5
MALRGRQEEDDPSGQSRLDCCFSYVELADAHAFLAECRRDGDPTRRRSLICTLETQDGARQAHYDRNLYDAVELDQPFAEAERRARSYWSGRTRDALIKRHGMGKNPGGTAYGYEKRIAYDLNGERTRGLQQIDAGASLLSSYGSSKTMPLAYRPAA